MGPAAEESNVTMWSSRRCALAPHGLIAQRGERVLRPACVVLYPPRSVHHSTDGGCWLRAYFVVLFTPPSLQTIPKESRTIGPPHPLPIYVTLPHLRERSPRAGWIHPRSVSSKIHLYTFKLRPSSTRICEMCAHMWDDINFVSRSIVYHRSVFYSHLISSQGEKIVESFFSRIRYSNTAVQ